ncbi:LamG-like jellyroll fold domain-containing protein [Streptomyces sp. NPDC021224]|uniref:LamG-like jellyroll fold domain-containing protein n=1 Tax=unclassified Streptomyces TaxID=2593676 RepID=UPI0037A933DD
MMAHPRRKSAARRGAAVLALGALSAAFLVALPPGDATADSGTPASTSVSSPAHHALSADEAAAKAESTGRPVVASALTTAVSQTTANPDGTLTLAQTATPTRVLKDGAWTAIDPTLTADPDGTLSPKATPSSVILSGGGTGPLLSLHTGGQGFTLTLPVSLPAPTVSGASAEYDGVLPGVDLTVTVDPSGGVSDVLTLHTPAAARNPQLATLLDADIATTPGLTAASDANGTVQVKDAAGHPIYTAPTPLAWDSAEAADTADTATANALRRDASGARPSSALRRGAAAHSRQVGVTAGHGRLALTPPTALLDASDTRYPVFVDPTYSPAYGATGWASPGSGVPSQNFWKSSVSYTGDAEVGPSGDVQDEAISLFNFPVTTSLKTAKIYSAHFDITETYSWACHTSGHNQKVDLYAPAKILSSSNATWNNWSDALGTRVDQQDFALGYGSGCPAGGAPPFDVTSTIAKDLTAGTTTQTLVMRADSHTDNYALKRFNPKTAQLVITYDKYPNTPKGLFTSPPTNCSNTVLGDTAVSLYAPVSTPTGAALTTTFTLYKTADTAKTNLLTPANGIAADTYHGGSGQNAVLKLPEAFFKARAAGASTSFTWRVQTSDGTLTSASSATCAFSWDASRPGAPGVSPAVSPPDGSHTCPTLDASDVGSAQSLGARCSFDVTPPTGGAISGYAYQLNQSAPVTVDATGPTTITVQVSRLVNTLTVNAVSPGGNLGSPTFVEFTGTGITPPARDGDINLDGTPDLVTVGGPGTAMPSGAWLATGHQDGTVAPAATDIGADGLQKDNLDTTAPPADWDGAQAITGDFCGNGAQDVLAYFSGDGSGRVVCNDGSSDPLEPGNPTTIGQSSAPYEIAPGSFPGADGTQASQVVAAGNTSGADTGLPDLLAKAGDQLYLAYSFAANTYSTGSDPGWDDCSSCYALTSLTSPDGTMDWDSWTIATAQLDSGTAMYLWKPATGELDLWTGLSRTPDGTSLTTTGRYRIAQSGWHQNPSDSLSLRAADLTGQGVPSLWAADLTTGEVTCSTPSALADAPELDATTTKLLTADHSWQFADIGDNDDGAVFTGSADSTGSLTLAPVASGTPAARWNTGDLFSPDVLLNGTAASDLHAGAAIGLKQSFTVSLWANPSAYGGAVLSQDGTSYSGVSIRATAGGWQASLSTADGSTSAADVITGGRTQLNTWTHLTLTYNSAIGVADLYVNDTYVATGAHAAPASGASGGFHLGSDLVGKNRADFYAGQVADVQVWAGHAIAPPQPSTPPGYHQAVTPTRILDTRTAAGLVHASHNVTAGTATVPGGSVVQLQISGDTVTPAVAGAPTKIPASVTAVAVEVTAANEQDHGYVTAYADGAQQPLSSSTNFAPAVTTTGYQIVPVGGDGKIDLYTHGNTTSDIALIVDLTGYFTSDATLTGDETYHPLPTASRILNTSVSTAGTSLTATGTVPANTTFTLDVAGKGGIPANATGVALNITTSGATSAGYLGVYANGSTPADPVTSLTYGTATPRASMAADTPTGTGGKITVSNHNGVTAVIVDASGYYLAGTSGQTYHAVNPTRLVVTSNGVGGLPPGPVTSNGTYTLSQADVRQITTAARPTLALMLTEASGTDYGYLTAYPADGSLPPTSNLNWVAGDTNANLAVVPTSADGKVVFSNHSPGTLNLIVDCSGYFAG